VYKDGYSRTPEITGLVVNDDDTFIVSGAFDFINGRLSPSLAKVYSGTQSLLELRAGYTTATNMVAYLLAQPDIHTSVMASSSLNSWQSVTNISSSKDFTEIKLPLDQSFQFFKAVPGN
jgi:hypothetical protein